MSGAICLRCLSRPLAPIEQSLLRPSGIGSSRIASFSTTPTLSAAPVKKKAAVPAKGQKGGQSFKLGKQGKVSGKNVRVKTGRPPAPGDRKALRKRIVLSNTNALEVQGMENFTVENMGDEKYQGQVLGLSDESIDSLRAIEAFKHTQGWSSFRRPATLVRKETTAMAQLVQGAAEAGSAKMVRKVLYGERGSGKSVLLLQAKAMAFLKGWVVIHIPEAQELTIAHTSYVPSTDSASGSTIYVQPHLTATLLGAIAKANHALLSTLRLSKKHNLPIPVQENISLARFAELGARDPDIAWPFYQALMEELTTPSQQGEGLTRPPVLFTFDSINHVMANSAYLSADLEKVHAHDLALVRHFMSFFSGAKKLSNGGAILAADSSSNRTNNPTFDFTLSRNEALASGKNAPEWNAYVKADQNVLKAMDGVDVWEIKGLTKDEARGVMEYYARSGMLRHTVNDSLIAEKWTLSGGGIIGALERASVLMRV
ncbi:hypothetical protein MBLNU459_g0316t1 [Dothideomycetes sp. NU459]